MKKLFKKSELATKNERNTFFWVNIGVFLFFSLIAIFAVTDVHERFQPFATYLTIVAILSGSLLGSLNYRYGKFFSRLHFMVNLISIMLIVAIMIFVTTIYSSNYTGIVCLNCVLGLITVSSLDLSFVLIQMLYNKIGMPYIQKKVPASKTYSGPMCGFCEIPKK